MAGSTSDSPGVTGDARGRHALCDRQVRHRGEPEQRLGAGEVPYLGHRQQLVDRAAAAEQPPDGVKRCRHLLRRDGLLR